MKNLVRTKFENEVTANVDYPTESRHVSQSLSRNSAFYLPGMTRKVIKTNLTHDRDVRGMGLFSSLRHKLLKVCNAIFL